MKTQTTSASVIRAGVISLLVFATFPQAGDPLPTMRHVIWFFRECREVQAVAAA
jgi:hypothetical protein